jgi:hypothetical protein
MIFGLWTSFAQDQLNGPDHLMSMRRMLMLQFFFAMIVVFFAQTLSAQDSVDRNCLDDNGQNRCGEKALAKTRERYDVSDAKTQAAEGTYLRRAMIVDGYGRDVLAVLFVREKGRDPYVEIRGAMAAERKEPRLIRTPMSEFDWNRVIAAGTFFDRDIAPNTALADDKESIPICLHSWMVLVESANPARLSSNMIPATLVESEIRSKTQNTCGGGLAVEYAFQLVSLAHEMIPVCKNISIETQRNKVMVLNACLSLSGDRAAAANGLTLFDEIRKALHIYPKNPAETQKALTRLIVFADPNMRVKTGSERLTESRRREMVELLSQGEIYFSAYTGIDADHIILEGTQIQDSADLNSDKRPERKIIVSASRQAGDFRIHDVEVSAFGK